VCLAIGGQFVRGSMHVGSWQILLQKCVAAIREA
jgi:hypothetical protein